MYIQRTRDIKNLNDFNEAAKALNPKILVVLKFGEDTLRFTLSESLTQEESDALNDLVQNFDDADPEVQVPKILAMAKEYSKHFHAINYIKGLNQSLGLYRYNSLANLTKLPNIALGGINKINLKLIKLINANGFASISYFKY